MEEYEFGEAIQFQCIQDQHPTTLRAVYLNGTILWVSEPAESEPAATVMEHMTQSLGQRQYEVTHGAAIREQHTATPSGLGRVATDGERINGRLAWVPGA